MGANDANLEISYHPEQGRWVTLSWHHGEHKIDAKADITMQRWLGLKDAVRAATSDYAVGRHVADLLGLVSVPIAALTNLGRRVRELL